MQRLDSIRRIVVPLAIAASLCAGAPAQAAETRPDRFVGMDQSVNVDLAGRAGIAARKPYLDVEQWGDLWTLMLLFGGGACGFVIGRYWDHIWGPRRAV